MTAPTQPTPAPLDLDGLAADLEAAGWERYSDGEDYISLRQAGDTIEIARDGSEINLFTGLWINALDPFWKRVLDAVRRHTQPTEGASE